jgi:DHA1 family bicyclomycin/chloramphenicol resistance-like MFS transporter
VAGGSFVSSVGMVSTTSFSLAMQSQGKSAGSASAFLGVLTFIGGAIVSPLVGIAGDQTAWPMGIIILVCSGIALLICIAVVKKSKLNTQNY